MDDDKNNDDDDDNKEDDDVEEDNICADRDDTMGEESWTRWFVNRFILQYWDDYNQDNGILFSKKIVDCLFFRQGFQSLISW